MAEVITQLPLAKVIKDALLEREGIIGEAINCCIAFERADWPNVKCANLDESAIQQAYFNAVIWSNEAAKLVSSH